MRKRLIGCVASLFVVFGLVTFALAEEEPGSAPTETTEHADDEAKHADDAESHSKGGDDHAEEHGEDHGDHGHHDPHDLGHSNAGVQQEDPSEWKADLAIWTFVVFICLLALLGKFAWGPIMDGLEKREASIAAMIDEAKESAENAAKQLQNYEAKLAAAGEEARELVAQARKDAEAAGERIKVEAQEAAQRERERAVADIEAAKNGALHELNEKSVDLAVQLAGQIVRRELKSDDHSQLIREALDKLPSRN